MYLLNPSQNTSSISSVDEIDAEQDSGQAPSTPQKMSGWYSLAGYLQLKLLGGGLSMLKPRRRYYFVLDEANCQLLYFKDENEFIRQRTSTGTIDLKNCAVSLSETSPKAFIIHAVGGRHNELEADNDQSAMVWLNCLQHRRDESRRHQLSTLHSALDMSSLSSNGTISRRSISSTSLPNDYEMASLLDTAYANSITNANLLGMPPLSPFGGTGKAGRSPPTTFKTQYGFYFPSSGCDSQSVSSAPSDPNDPPADPSTSHNPTPTTEDPPSLLTPEVSQAGGGLAGPNSARSNLQQRHSDGSNGETRRERTPSTNAESLQNWIKNWLHSQQENTEENTENDFSNSWTFGSMSQSFHSSRGTVEPETQWTGDDWKKLQKDLRTLKDKDRDNSRQLALMRQRIRDLTSQLEINKAVPGDDPGERAKYLQKQNKFLNSEIIRLASKYQDESGMYVKLTRRVGDLESELDSFKREYVYLLQSCIRIPVGERCHSDMVEVKLFGGDVHKTRVCMLLEEARMTDPTLPTFESVNNGNCHVDVYGFRHSFSEEPLALHYICTQLHLHYQAQMASQHQHKHRWKLYLARTKNILVNNKETRQLVRSGIPPSYRSAVWRCLIHQQVVDLKLKFGKYYYRNLCASNQSSADVEFSSLHQKQISLDLLRTMPNNVHFSSPTCKGVNQLQQVLRALCLHNSKIGYCQGMNFVAGTCLLFLSPEDTFWFLVALTERYFVDSYFDNSLTGAQADQEVLKELLEAKLPRLAEHLFRCDIDLATVTLNWFLAVFFDAVPFQTMLRIWDCFLLEGPKVLFRFALALLCLHESTVMERSDTISVMKVLKAAARLTYDVDGLVKLAFEGLKPFPRRCELVAKQTCFLNLLVERLKKREELKAVLTKDTSNANLKANQVVIETAICFNDEDGLVLLVFGRQNMAQLAIVDCKKSIYKTLDCVLDCRITSVAIGEGGVVFVSLISAYMVALAVNPAKVECEKLWELKLTDVAMHLICKENRLFATLVNGSLAVIENAAEKTPNFLELYYIPIGPAPLATAAVISDTQLWCAMGSKAVILNSKTLDSVEHLYVAGSVTGGCVSFFEKILCFLPSPQGVWLATANSSLVQLWDNVTFTCRLLFDICSDHRGRHGHGEADAEAQITALLCHESVLWVGTADGYLILYDVVKKCGLSHSQMMSPGGGHIKATYPAGRRISPCNSTGRNLYIPPKEEMDDRETSSRSSVVSMINTKTNTPPDNDNHRDSGYSGSIESTVTAPAGLDDENGHITTEHESRLLKRQTSCTLPPSKANRFRENQKHMRNRPAGGSLKLSGTAAKVARKKRDKLRFSNDARRESFNIDQDVIDLESPTMERPRSNSLRFDEGSEELPTMYRSVGEKKESLNRRPSNGRRVIVRPRSLVNLSDSKEDEALEMDSGRGQKYSTGSEQSNRKSSEECQESSSRRASDESNDARRNSSAIGRLRNAQSASSLVSGPAELEYDDLFYLYQEDEKGNTNGRKISRRGGLASAKLARSESVWSLRSEGLPWSLEQYIANKRKESDGDVMIDHMITSSANRPASLKLRRKDLEFDMDELNETIRASPTPTYHHTSPAHNAGGYMSEADECGVLASETASVVSLSSTIDPPFAFALDLQMKLKIADKPIKSILVCRTCDYDIILTCAGNFGDEESILRWKREHKTGLWINDPVVMQPETKITKSRR